MRGGGEPRRLRRLRRGGEYHRVADPEWDDPLDGSFAGRLGGRWNPPGSSPVVYLNASLRVARANVLRKLEGQPFGPEDLNPEGAPVLVTTEVPEEEFADLVTDEGCRAAGLPESYPWREPGAGDGNATGAGREKVPWEDCQPVGSRAREEGAPGLSCRSAAGRDPEDLGPEDEELAYFPNSGGEASDPESRHRGPLTARRTQPFEEWFWPRSPRGSVPGSSTTFPE